MESDNRNTVGNNIKVTVLFPKTSFGRVDVEIPSDVYDTYGKMTPYNKAKFISDIVGNHPDTEDDMISVKDIAGAIEVGYASVRPYQPPAYPNLVADPGCDCFL